MEVGKVVSKTRPDVTWSAKHDHIVLVGRGIQDKKGKCLQAIEDVSKTDPDAACSLMIGSG